MIAARSVWLVMLALAASACSAPAHRPYDPALRGQIRTIGLPPPAVSERTAVRLMVHPIEGLGMVGLVIAEGDMSAKTADFSRAMQLRGYRGQAQFHRGLVHALSDAGYRVQALKLAREPGNHAFLEHYPAADGTVDAYLDVYSNLIGYAAAGVSTPYRPTVHLTARLVRASDGRTLWQDRIAYNDFGQHDAVTIAATDAYQFQAYEQLMADPDRAYAGLQTALRATGDELARQLR